eukprot:6781537-Prymnesium_polylepis.3
MPPDTSCKPWQRAEGVALPKHSSRPTFRIKESCESTPSVPSKKKIHTSWAATKPMAIEKRAGVKSTPTRPTLLSPPVPELVLLFLSLSRSSHDSSARTDKCS